MACIPQDLLQSSDFPSLKAAIIAWMSRGGTLVISRDHVEREPITTEEGVFQRGKRYRLETDGARTVTYDGPDVPVFWRWYSETASDLFVAGNLTIDCLNKAGVGLLVDSWARFRERGVCEISGLRVRNCKLRTGAISAHGASGLTVLGGFSSVWLRNVHVRSVGRDDGSGQPGSFGSTGIQIFGRDGTTANAQQIRVEGCSVQDVGSDDPPSTARFTDMDGLLIFQFKHGTDTVTGPAVRDFMGRNCCGRGIKRYSTAFGGVTERFSIWQDRFPRHEGFQAVAHQDGSGVIRDGRIYLSDHANDQPSIPISMSLGAALDNRGGHIENITIQDTTGVDLAALVSLYRNVRDNHARSFTLANILHTGRSEQLLALGALGAYGPATITLRKIDTRIVSALARTDDALPQLRVKMSGVRNHGAPVPYVRRLDGRLQVSDIGTWTRDEFSSGLQDNYATS